MAVNPIPDEYPQVSPYLVVDGAADAIEYYKTVFGATERFRMDGPPGKIGHAEIEIGRGLLMLADEFPDMGAVGPRTVGGTPVSITVYVEDVDSVFQRAIENGGKELQPVEDRFYGDRAGQLEDPWGHHWSVMTHVEDVSPEEMERRAAEQAGTGGDAPQTG